MCVFEREGGVVAATVTCASLFQHATQSTTSTLPEHGFKGSSKIPSKLTCTGIILEG